MPFFSARNLCPNCAKPISSEANTCDACGCELEPRNPGGGPPLPNGVARHRGKQIVGLAVVSLLALPFTGTALSCAGYLGTSGWPSAMPLVAMGLGFLTCGQFSAAAGVVFAFRDWVGMKAGRVDPNGKWRTVFGGLLAAFSMLLFWWMIGAVIFSLL